MSDLRLEDLLTITEYGRGHATAMRGCVRQVSRVEVLVALGAEREWHCARPALGECWFAQYPGIPPTGHREEHRSCGWRWVVTDE